MRMDEKSNTRQKQPKAIYWVYDIDVFVSPSRVFWPPQPPVSPPCGWPARSHWSLPPQWPQQCPPAARLPPVWAPPLAAAMASQPPPPPASVRQRTLQPSTTYFSVPNLLVSILLLLLLQHLNDEKTYEYWSGKKKIHCILLLNTTTLFLTLSKFKCLLYLDFLPFLPINLWI